MLNYYWKFQDKQDESTVKQLASSLKMPKSLASVLVARGMNTESNVKKFFSPTVEDIHDPYLMDGMDVAVDRILHAIKQNELIWIHGDYDVDGTTSTAMMLMFLRSIGAKVDYHIPDRFQEGYGLTVSNVDIAHKKNVNLILTVDVGITSLDSLDYAFKLGMDTIICDHHEPAETLPKAVAILDPFIPGSNYPFKYLAACGVAFKLIQAIGIRLGIEEKAFEYLDFVAIASAADMVPMIGENRVLVTIGLELLNEKPRPGIKGLLYCTNLKVGQITSSGIVFALAPLINAAGRLGDACRSVEMMSQACEIQAFQMAQQLEQENRRRRIFDEQTFEQTIPLAEKLISSGNRKSLVLHGNDWHAGVIGIVASRLVDRFHLPTVLLTTMHNMAKGSARSIINFDIHTALKQTSHLLFEFGGHKHAAGLSMKIENVPIFSDLFEEIAGGVLTHEMMTPELAIDAELNLHELSPIFMKQLDKFAPFGFDNYKPIFYSKNISSKNGIKIVGANHIKFRAQQSHPDFPDNSNMKFEIDAIGHNLADKIHLCSHGRKFSIAYNLEEYNYNGHTSIQLRIRDLRLED
jgi:single-stranded-DNA-specific exonuclease